MATSLRDPAIKAEARSPQLYAAKIIAESEALLSRIRAARVELIEQMSPILAGQEAEGSQFLRDQLPQPDQLLIQLLRFERYESAALGRWGGSYIFARRTFGKDLKGRAIFLHEMRRETPKRRASALLE